MKHLVELGSICTPTGCGPAVDFPEHLVGDQNVEKVYTPFGVRCRNNEGQFVACSPGMKGLGSSRRSGRLPRLRGSRSGGLGLGQLAMNLPVVGRVNVPNRIQFDLWPGLGGALLGKIVPGMFAGVMGNLFGPTGSTLTKIGLGLATAAAFLSPRVRRSSLAQGFGLIVLTDMAAPLVQTVVDMIVPPSVPSGSMSAPLTAQQRSQLQQAEQALTKSRDPRFIQMAGRRGMGVVRGRTVMTASDYLNRAAAAQPLSGPPAHPWLKGVMG